MARWEGNAHGRLSQAAYELYAERGYDKTTVADIAERAGLTERTFFRYFEDKREVLFDGAQDLEELVVESLAEALEAAPPGAAPLDALAHTFEAAGEMMEERVGVERARQRNAVIMAHAELRERELIKLATLGAGIAETLREHGVKEPAATLAAEAGIAIFKTAFERWLTDDKGRGFRTLVREAVKALKTVTGAR